MIGFGELRRLSAQWHVDIGTVERAYVIDWLLKGMFDVPRLSESIVLRGASALRYAYCRDYASVEEPEFLVPAALGDDERCAALAEALDTAKASGVQYGLVDCQHGTAKVEYVGPLGRRSAAQPRIFLSFITGGTRLAPVQRPLMHPFGDACAATVSATALEEVAAERMAALAAGPRARDLFDLWFVLSRPYFEIDRARVRELAEAITQSKNVQLPPDGTLVDPQHRPALERAWDNALRRIAGHPALEQVERELAVGPSGAPRR
ncbi:MAG: nucleotidyl transferase AbiEii/AbiGii toxin family protein [Chloroflexi bacterium]|nr:nucleotidyl transferase AbiEii/AbiGii toxin family protein [Chloroflexota bacterium]